MWNDAIVLLNCGKVTEIGKIICMNVVGCYCLVKKCSVEKVSVGDVELPHIWKKLRTEKEKFLVSTDDVCGKMVHDQFEDKSYVCWMPNFVNED